ncbi:hypothetical protein TNCV_4015201 [Trichonephila clavipes]|nr:hypothetical protein TNCV_4015201 [Trichonephila clavipes]
MMTHQSSQELLLVNRQRLGDSHSFLRHPENLKTSGLTSKEGHLTRLEDRLGLRLPVGRGLICWLHSSGDKLGDGSLLPVA